MAAILVLAAPLAQRAALLSAMHLKLRAAAIVAPVVMLATKLVVAVATDGPARKMQSWVPATTRITRLTLGAIAVGGATVLMNPWAARGAIQVAVCAVAANLQSAATLVPAAFKPARLTGVCFGADIANRTVVVSATLGACPLAADGGRA